MDRQNKRNALNDFQRFQVMVLRRQRNYDRSHLNSKKKKVVPPPAPKKEEKKTPKSKGGAKGKKGKKSAGAQ
jgi:hypothetical protein